MYRINFSPTNLNWMAAGFTQMSDFWDRNLYNGTTYAPLDASENGGATLGLAEWCNGNFLTVRGSYVEYPGQNTNGSFGVTNYPYPSVNSTDLSNYLANPAAFAKEQNDGTYRYVLKKSSQGVTVPEHCAIDLLAAVWTNEFGPGNQGGVAWVHPDDPDVMASYHSILIPKAIAYSTGLLNYYFRGRLQILCSGADGQTCQFAAMNISPQAFSGGGFRLFSDDSLGNRTEVELSTTYTNYLATNAAITGTFSVPASSGGVFTLAYFGSIGGDPIDGDIGCASIVFSNSGLCECTLPSVKVFSVGGQITQGFCSSCDYSDTNGVVNTLAENVWSSATPDWNNIPSCGEGRIEVSGTDSSCTPVVGQEAYSTGTTELLDVYSVLICNSEYISSIAVCPCPCSDLCFDATGSKSFAAARSRVYGPCNAFCVTWMPLLGSFPNPPVSGTYGPLTAGQYVEFDPPTASNSGGYIGTITSGSCVNGP